MNDRKMLLGVVAPSLNPSTGFNPSKGRKISEFEDSLSTYITSSRTARTHRETLSQKLDVLVLPRTEERVNVTCKRLTSIERFIYNITFNYQVIGTRCWGKQYPGENVST